MIRPACGEKNRTEAENRMEGRAMWGETESLKSETEEKGGLMDGGGKHRMENERAGGTGGRLTGLLKTIQDPMKL